MNTGNNKTVYWTGYSSTVGVLSAVSFFLGMMVIATWSDNEAKKNLIFNCFITLALASFVFTAAWLLLKRVKMDMNGIAYFSLTKIGFMKWSDLAKVYLLYSSKANGKILWKYRFIDKKGKELVFGGFFNGGHVMNQNIIDTTKDILYPELSKKFTDFEEIDFGSAVLSRITGIKKIGLAGIKIIPLEELAACEIEDGFIYLYNKNGKTPDSLPIAETANVIIFRDILTDVLKTKNAEKKKDLD